MRTISRYLSTQWSSGLCPIKRWVGCILDVQDILSKCHDVEIVLIDICPVLKVLDSQPWIICRANIRPKALDSAHDPEYLGGFGPVPGAVVD